MGNSMPGIFSEDLWEQTKVMQDMLASMEPTAAGTTRDWGPEQDLLLESSVQSTLKKKTRSI